MSIRPYTPDDLGAVVAIFRSNIPKYFGPGEESDLREFLAEERDEYFLIETEGEIVGSDGIALNLNDTVSLCWGMIRSDHHGTGKGRELTEFRLAMAKEQFGDLPVVIDTSQHTQGFYGKFGFQITERRPNGFGPGLDICKMRLERGSNSVIIISEEH